MFGTFGSQGFGFGAGDDSEERDALKKLDISLAKNPVSSEVSDEAREAAERLFEAYAAFVQAGFTPGEALRIVLAQVANVEA